MSGVDPRRPARSTAQAEVSFVRGDRGARSRRELDHLPPGRRQEARACAPSRPAARRGRDPHSGVRARDQSARARGKTMRWIVAAAIVLTAGCGPKRPPPSFAPDPGLVEQIREIRMSTSTRACPGESFAATYTAVLNDGSIVPFESRYDEDRPPRLHVIFLNRTSPDATPLQAGGWSAAHDPLATAITGFRLSVSMNAKPS